MGQPDHTLKLREGSTRQLTYLSFKFNVEVRNESAAKIMLWMGASIFIKEGTDSS
jgi:hypothetical protein